MSFNPERRLLRKRARALGLLTPKPVGMPGWRAATRPKKRPKRRAH